MSTTGFASGSYSRFLSYPPAIKIIFSLKAFIPDKVIWDIEDISKQPPWGDNISKDITNLSNYFITSDGEYFISVFFHALEKSKEVNSDIEIKSV